MSSQPQQCRQQTLVSFWVDKETYQQLDSACESQQVTSGRLIEALIHWYLDNPNEKLKQLEIKEDPSEMTSIKENLLVDLIHTFPLGSPLPQQESWYQLFDFVLLTDKNNEGLVEKLLIGQVTDEDLTLGLNLFELCSINNSVAPEMTWDDDEF
jgi:hypothetical protein